MTTQQTTTNLTTCKARVADATLPTNTAQVRQCRNTAKDGSKWCEVHH